LFISEFVCGVFCVLSGGGGGRDEFVSEYMLNREQYLASRLLSIFNPNHDVPSRNVISRILYDDSFWYAYAFPIKKVADEWGIIAMK
jgi:hypothetical protein